jgi:hypothetical protein
VDIAIASIAGPLIRAGLHPSGFLTGAVTGEHAAALSGLFSTTTRTGGVIGTAAFGTAYLALAPHPDQAVRGFTVICLTLAGTALAAAAMATVAVRAARPA